MEKLNRIDGVYYTQNVEELPIEERVFFVEGLVADVNDYRAATNKEIEEWKEWKEHQKKQEEEMML